MSYVVRLWVWDGVVFDCFFFFVKQKTAYVMRISDWSSDVCSSDLHVADVLSQSSIVDSAFSDIEPTKATIYLTLKKGHEQSSVDWEREMAPKLQDIADARVNFQSQSGGGFGRDITKIGRAHV